MPKFVYLCMLIATTVFTGFGHEALMTVEDNGDGTILIKTSLSTGENAQGALVILKDKSTGQPIDRFSLPPSGGKVVPMPTVPYTVTLLMGKGHSVTQTGPFKGQATTAAAKPDSVAAPSTSDSLAAPLAATATVKTKNAWARYTGPLTGLVGLMLIGFIFALRKHGFAASPKQASEEKRV
jgi:hypothetical protein